VPEDPGGRRGLSAARPHQAEEEPGPLRLRRRAVLHRRRPGRAGQKQAAGGVSAPTQAGPEEDEALWEEEDDGGEELLKDSENFVASVPILLKYSVLVSWSNTMLDV